MREDGRQSLGFFLLLKRWPTQGVFFFLMCWHMPYHKLFSHFITLDFFNNFFSSSLFFVSFMGLQIIIKNIWNFFEIIKKFSLLPRDDRGHLTIPQSNFMFIYSCRKQAKTRAINKLTIYFYDFAFNSAIKSS